jgi:sarcinarray family protein
MNYRFILLSVLCLMVMFSSPASSESQYGKIDVYYNDQLYPGNSTPKPLLKIGEPFNLRFEVTCYKRNFLAVQLWSIGNDDFVILDGPTERLGTGTRGIIEANETRVFEWTVAPTEAWAGGSTPINFYYQMTDLERPITLTSGEFTAAYVTISNEYYEPSASTGPGTQPSGDTASPALPAFTLLGALAAVYAVYVLRRP